MISVFAHFNHLSRTFFYSPYNLINPFDQPLGGQSSFNPAQGFVGPTLQPQLGGSNQPIRTYRGQILKTQIGRVEDPELLDLVTRYTDK